VYTSPRDCPPDSSEPKNMHISHSDLFAGLSSCDTTVLCSEGLNSSSDPAEPALAPKLRWLLEAINRSQSTHPDAGMHQRSSDSSAPQFFPEPQSKPRSGSLLAQSPATKSSTSHRNFQLKAAPAPAACAVASNLLIPTPTVPPTIAPRAPAVAASGSLTTPSPALSHQGATLEAMRLIFPNNASRPRFDENSIMAAMGSSSSGMSQLLMIMQSQDPVEHRSPSNVVPSLHDTLSLVAETTTDGEANMEFFSGLFRLAGVTEVRLLYPFDCKGRAERHGVCGKMRSTSLISYGRERAESPFSNLTSPISLPCTGLHRGTRGGRAAAGR
jgi:hypothetical protein